MSDTNVVIVTGRLTRDPEGRRTNSGTSVCELGIASNQREKQGEDWVDVPVFIDCTVFGRQADFCRDYLHKGSPVLVQARLKLDQWEDRATGQKRSKLKLVANSVQSLDTRSNAENSQDGYQSTRSQNDAPASRNAAGYVSNAAQRRAEHNGAPPPPFPAEDALPGLEPGAAPLTDAPF